MYKINQKHQHIFEEIEKMGNRKFPKLNNFLFFNMYKLHNSYFVVFENIIFVFFYFYILYIYIIYTRTVVLSWCRGVVYIYKYIYIYIYYYPFFVFLLMRADLEVQQSPAACMGPHRRSRYVSQLT